MARIPLVRLRPSPQALDEAPARSAVVRLALRAARRRFGTEPDNLAAMAHHRGVLTAWTGFELAVERQRSVLPDRLRELVVLAAAVEIGCSWCVDFGASLWEGQGLDPAVLREVVAWRDSTAFTADERAAFAYACALTAQPPEVTDEMVHDLRTRFGDAGVVELTFVAALENLRSRFNGALGLTGQGFSSGEACDLAAARRDRPTSAG